ncbi:MAG: prepilin peptidase [Alphaproteobacteria bacterium]|nr:prepilin peptidase [Alphaproteobacteria bacterium]
MIAYITGSFIFGLFIPYIARRFAKFMPSTPANAIWQTIRINKFLLPVYYTKQFKSFMWRSFFSGIVTCGLSYILAYKFGIDGLGWILFYTYTLLLLAEIDWRMYLLPDILTVPLLIFGFAYSVLGNGWIIGADSALGAIIGYLLPVLVSFLLLKKNKDAFGGGDIKLLSAIGAWVGVEPLLYVIAGASILMLIYSLVRKQKAVAFGPALSLSAIAVAIIIF